MSQSGANALFRSDALSLLERLPGESTALVYLDPPWDAHTIFFGNETITDGSDRKYIEFLSKVVQQSRRILKDDGSLIVHWLTTSPVDVRLVTNQAFGDQPRYEIVWQTKRHSHLRQGVPRTDNEILIVYSKSQTPVYNTVFRSLTREEKAVYGARDSRGEYRLVDLTVPFDRPAGQFLWRGFKPPERRSWRFPLERLETLYNEDMIYFPNLGGLPRMKQYLSDHSGIEIGTTWTDIPSAIPSHMRTTHVAQRPIALLERVIELATHKDDQILDPFFGSGTTLVAAHNLGRRWWGADNLRDAHQITEKRLQEVCGLNAGQDYALYSQTDVLSWSVVSAAYRDVLSSIHDIAAMQQEIKTLTRYLGDLKRLMNISADASDDQVEAAINQMEHWITTSITHQSVTSYIDVVRSWLDGWDRLERASQSFLPQAEMLFDGIKQSDGEDYSPFIIQYCRAMENELLSKLFVAYTDDVHARKEGMASILRGELENEKTGRFATRLASHDVTYTLGDMSFVLNLMKQGGTTLQRSELLKDFRAFVVRYFGERILEKQYLDQIGIINTDFRRKAAHPYILDVEAAERCRLHVRKCLNEFILNYRQGDLMSST